MKDYAYDTFKSSLFTNDDLYHTNSSRVRYKMDYTGSTSTIPVYWALRSASTNDGFFVGCVYGDGYVGDRLYVYYPWSAVVPACLIG